MDKKPLNMHILPEPKRSRDRVAKIEVSHHFHAWPFFLVKLDSNLCQISKN